MAQKYGIFSRASQERFEEVRLAAEREARSRVWMEGLARVW
jgi:hypothetical protein